MAELPFSLTIKLSWRMTSLLSLAQVRLELLEYSAGGVLILELLWKSSPRGVLVPLYWLLVLCLLWIHLRKSWNCEYLCESFSTFSCDQLHNFLKSLISFLREFPVRLENPHVISSDQIWAGVVPVGPMGCSLNSSYGKRDSLEYKQDLGNAIGVYFIPEAYPCFDQLISVDTIRRFSFCECSQWWTLLNQVRPSRNHSSYFWTLPCSQFCAHCSWWTACFLSILLSNGPMHWMLEEHGKLNC